MEQRKVAVIVTLVVIFFGFGNAVVLSQDTEITPCLLLDGQSWLPVSFLPDDLQAKATKTMVLNGISFVSLKEFAEDNGGNALWNKESECVELEIEGDLLVFKAQKPEVFWQLEMVQSLNLTPNEEDNGSSSHPDLAPLPQLEGLTGRIAFASTRDGGRAEIYMMNPDGTDPIRLTYNDAYDGEPSLSWDGTKIAFVSDRDGNREIYVMNADGTNQTRLTNDDDIGMRGVDDILPSFSPDGTKIVFASNSGEIPETDVVMGNFEIYVMNADGTERQNITMTSGYDWYPAWSPDGTKIVFNSYRDGKSELYVMNADGTDPTRLTYNEEFKDEWEPAWSPDGTRIAFVTNYDDRNVFQVYVMNTDGTNVVRLTSDDASSNTNPSWSPDGTRIVFESYRDDKGRELYMMNSDGTGLIRLSRDTDGSDFDPDWSPAGAKMSLTN